MPWAQGLKVPGPTPRRFQRELPACHELLRPAQLVMGTLESGATGIRGDPWGLGFHGIQLVVYQEYGDRLWDLCGFARWFLLILDGI